MFNPDDKEERYVKLKPNQSYAIQIQDEQTLFDQYLMDSKMVRERFGIGKEHEKFYVKDLDLIKALDPALKQRLEAFRARMKREEKWLNK